MARWSGCCGESFIVSIMPSMYRPKAMTVKHKHHIIIGPEAPVNSVPSLSFNCIGPDTVSRNTTIVNASVAQKQAAMIGVKTGFGTELNHRRTPYMPQTPNVIQMNTRNMVPEKKRGAAERFSWSAVLGELSSAMIANSYRRARH